MNSFIDSLLSMLSFTELPYSILVVVAILITGVHIFLLMALFATLAVYFERKVSIYDLLNKKNTLNQIAVIKMIKIRSVSVIILKMLSVNF